jgi:hypothetical protein
LENKYGIGKKTLKNFLVLMGIKVKNKEESLKEVRRINKEKGIRAHNFGKTPKGGNYCPWYLYEGIKYQGSWEFKFGLWLKFNRIEFLCHKEVQRFKYKKIDSSENSKSTTYTYCPDFYLPAQDTYIEVKGYYDKEAMEKMTLVKKFNPTIKFEIYDKKRFLQEDILNIDKKLGLCVDDYRIDYKTGELQIKEFLERIDKDELIRKHFIEKSSLIILAGQYNLPYKLMRRIFNLIAPQLGTEAIYRFYFDKFFNQDHLKTIKKSKSVAEAARHIENGLAYKCNVEIIKRFGVNLLLPSRRGIPRLYIMSKSA